MIITKYNRPNATSKAVETRNASSSSSSSSTTINNNGTKLNRNLWGNHDDGSDIDGTQHINGSVYAHKADYSYETDENAEKPRYEDEEDDVGGSHIAELDVKAGRNVISEERMFLPYPTPKDKLEDLAPLIKSLADRITALEQSGGSSGAQPDGVRILIAGLIKRASQSNRWAFDDANGYVDSSIRQINDSISHSGRSLQIMIQAASGYQVDLASAMCQQAVSGMTEAAGQYLEDRHGVGAHWFETKFNRYGDTGWMVVINEFHLDGDGWSSTTWTESNAMNEVEVIVIGRVKRVS